MILYCIKELISEKISGEWGSEPDESSSVKVLRTTNFTNSGIINFEKVVQRNISKLIVNKKRLQQGDVIIEKSGGSPSQPVGRVVYFDKAVEEPILCNNFTTILRPNEKVFPKYFFYALYANHLTGKTLKFQNKTTGIINLKLERYLDEKIPLPPLSEQKRIADILDKADSLRQKRKESIALLDELLKSVFIDMFGDPVRNEKGWEVRRIGDSIVETNSINPKGLPEHIFEYIDISSVNNKHKIIDEFQVVNGREAPSRARQVVMLEDIIVSTVRPNLNAVAMIKQNYRRALASTGFCVLRSNRIKISPYYLFQICKHDYFVSALSKIAKGASYPAVSNNDVKNVKIILPPIKKQILFENVVKRIESTNNSFSKSLSDMEHQFNALLQRAFRGEEV